MARLASPRSRKRLGGDNRRCRIQAPLPCLRRWTAGIGAPSEGLRRDPILVGHHTCEGRGCFQAHYCNHYHLEVNKTVNRFTTSLRHASSLASRQDDMESGSADNDGGGKLFTDYDFQNDVGDERAEDYDGGFLTRFLNLVGAETSYTQQDCACMSVVDTDDNNNIGAQGYITIGQGENIADPQSEAGYIASCT